MPQDNRIIVDLSKVQWARFGYRNQYGQWANYLPGTPTVRNGFISDSELAFGHSPYTMLQYAIKEGLLDRWTPELKLKVTANCILVYTGDKAKTLFKAFCERQFNPSRKKGKK